MKRVLITGGPTNEYIDEVMKITNMSTGKVAVQLAALFARGGYHVTLCLTRASSPKCLTVASLSWTTSRCSLLKPPNS